MAKDVIILKEMEREELLELVGEVIDQITIEIEKLNKEEEANLDSIFISARVVENFEAFILFLIWDQPDKTQARVNIFYKITSKCNF